LHIAQQSHLVVSNGNIEVGEASTLLIDGNSQATVEGGDLVVKDTGNLLVLQASTLSITSGSVRLTGSTKVQVSADSRIINYGSLYTSSQIELPSSSPLQNYGSIYFNEDTQIVGVDGSGAGSVENDGSLNFEGSNSNIASSVNSRGNMVFGASSSVSAQGVTSSGTIQFAGGSVSLSTGQPFLMQLGDMNGVGAISGTFVNSAGSITHGSDAGTSLDIDGSFENSASGNIYATVDDLVGAGAGFTQLRINGQARLGGTIYICIAPELEQETAANSNPSEINLMQYSDVLGTFDAIKFECTPQHRNARGYEVSFAKRAQRWVQSVESIFGATCSPRTVTSGINFSVLLGGCNGSSGGIDSVEPSWYIVISVAIGIIILVIIIFGGGLCYSEHQRKKSLQKTMKRKRMRMIREETEVTMGTSASSGMSSASSNMQ